MSYLISQIGFSCFFPPALTSTPEICSKTKTRKNTLHSVGFCFVFFIFLVSCPNNKQQTSCQTTSLYAGAASSCKYGMQIVAVCSRRIRIMHMTLLTVLIVHMCRPVHTSDRYGTLTNMNVNSCLNCTVTSVLFHSEFKLSTEVHY